MFAAVFRGTGVQGLGIFGFDDYLGSLGHADVSTDILSLVQQSRVIAETLMSRASLREQIDQMDARSCRQTTRENRLVEICAFHGDIKLLVTKLKTDFLSVLSALKGPTRTEGDND
jgi:hypothetical protein